MPSLSSYLSPPARLKASSIHLIIIGIDMEQLKILFLGVKFGVKDFTFYTFVVIFVVAVPQQNKTTILMKHDCCVHLPVIRIKSYLLLQLPRAELFSTIKW